MKKLPENRRIAIEMMKIINVPKGAKPHKFVQICWDWYKANYPSKSSQNGWLFENIVELALDRAGIPFIYRQVKLNGLTLAVFDLMLFEGNVPLVFPLKTTLRERWKQAELEARVLKQLYPDAECYLITLSEKEVKARRNAPEQLIGIDGFVLANTPEFDEFVKKLQKRALTPATEGVINTSDRTVIQELKDILSNQRVERP